MDTDINGNSIAGRTIKLGLSVAQIASATGNGKVDGAMLEISFDEGKTWKKVELVPDGNGGQLILRIQISQEAMSPFVQMLGMMQETPLVRK